MDEMDQLTHSGIKKYLESERNKFGFNLILLTDHQGLPIAFDGMDMEKSENQAAVLAMLHNSLHAASQMLNSSSTTEFTLISLEGKKLVVRPFFTKKSEYILAVELSKNDGPYKRGLNTIIKSLKSQWNN
jgi:hypothetical protein